MSSACYQKLLDDQPKRNKSFSVSIMAIAVSIGAIVGLGISKASADSSLYTAAGIKAVPVVQAQTFHLPQTTRVAATTQDNLELQQPLVPEIQEAATSSTTAGWTSLAVIPLAAVAGFFFGSRKPKENVETDPIEVVIDDSFDDFAMAATTAAKNQTLGMLGHKVGMTRIPDANGSLTPVTVIRLGPCVVTQVKTKATDGYEAVQLGFHEVKEKKLTQPERGHLAKSGAPPLKHLQEYRVGDASQYAPGQVFLADLFSVGDFVDISGEIIGKGFQGPIRLHGFKRGLKTHGSKSYREPGSTGPGTTPGRVYPGSKGPGRWGGRTTIRKLQVMGVDTEQHLLLVKGGIPGPSGNLVNVKPAIVW